MLETLAKENLFELKQAVERLREGLFDPLAVRLLTAHEAQLKSALDKVLNANKSTQPEHLIICGDYGQGKSHSLNYIRDQAIQQGFVVSRVNLDLREMTMHTFRQIYSALVNDMCFPDTHAIASEQTFSQHWRNWARQHTFSSQQTQLDDEQEISKAQQIVDFFPETMPHLFRCTLTALTQKNITLSEKQKSLKKYSQFRPKEYPDLLSRALSGDVVPYVRLRQALKFRQVPGYTKGSLSCKGNQPYLDMINSLSWLIQQMGYKGWILLFDEAESISQLRIMARSQSYHLLQQLLYSEQRDSNSRKSQHKQGKLIPVFALTDDFFDCLRQEDYQKVRIQNDKEIPYFRQNYTELLDQLNVFRLHDLTLKEWEVLIEKLIQLYCRAYDWKTNQSELQSKVFNYLKTVNNKETRLKIKAVINELDLEYQDYLWN